MTSTDSEKRDERIGLKGVEYHKPDLCGRIFDIPIPEYDEIHRPVQPAHPFYTYHDAPFDKERYRYSTLPVHLGPEEIKYDIDKVVNVLRCPIKQAGDRTLIVPDELAFLSDFITRCAIYETCFNDRFEDLFMHITVHAARVEAGETQRVGGFHVDGFQGHKFPIKREIEHSYLWASVCGTEFCPQPFFLEHIDDSKYHMSFEMDKTARESNVVTLLPKNIYVFDPYMVHRSPVIPENRERLLVRLTCEYQKLLDPNDTPNPGMRIPLPYKYDIRNSLGEYTVPLNVKSYGFADDRA
jgi:hypothetical protein